MDWARGRRRAAMAVLAAVVGGGALALPVGAAGPPEPAARPFTVTVHSQPLYGVGPQTHQQVLEAADGTDLFVETWLPAARGGHVPPARVPVVVSISPYLARGASESPWLRDVLVPHGYAYANVHVRGTGESGGCLDLFGPIEAADGVRAVQWLKDEAPFSTGKVGAYGVSYPGGTPLSAAGAGAPLDAIVSGAPYHSMHEAQWTFDGVPSFLVPFTTPGAYFLESMRLSDFAQTGDPRTISVSPYTAEKPGCQPEHAQAAADWSGNHTDYHRARDNRRTTERIAAPTLMFHGHADLVPMGGSPPSIQRGLFDQLPASTPKAGIFGVFGHHRPPRGDFPAMVVAWFDHWLKGIDSSVGDWPVAQVQGTDGQWRAEPGWPTTGGPVGHLAVGPGGTLGARTPTGSTQYFEGAYETTAGSAPGTQAVFETAPVRDRLELTGQPVLDLWVTLAVPDAHVAARLEVLGPDGSPVPRALTYGLRSAQHLDDFEDGRFVQAQPVPAPVLRPVRVPVRFQPTDLVVPEGGRLRLTVAGSLIVNPGLSQLGFPEPLFLGPSQASGVVAPVTIHHDCLHTSALRFEQPAKHPDVLAVDGAPSGGPPAKGRSLASDGGGITTAPVCGKKPVRIPELG